jgi:cytochrome c oxidase cbb3-type subunit 3
MSSRFLNSTAAAAAIVALLAACDADRRAGAAPSDQDAQADAPIQLAQNQQRPAVQEPPTQGGAGPHFSGDAEQIKAGGQLAAKFNCIGCHFNGGGGIGPAFLDDVWVYGDSIEQIHAVISNGTPNGMPTWQGKIPDEQIWQLAAFVESLPSDKPIPTDRPAATESAPGSLDAKGRVVEHATP